VTLASLDRARRGVLLDRRREYAHARPLVERLAVRIASLDQRVDQLSGGNQQKVVLAKSLGTRPRVLLLDEPTRGIDVGAKREIYGLVHELKRQGMAIVWVSSELPELLGNADRIMVLCEGRKSGEFAREEASEAVLMSAAVPGVHAHA
jgi:ribose transport system ATP-binding protein